MIAKELAYNRNLTDFREAAGLSIGAYFGAPKKSRVFNDFRGFIVRYLLGYPNKYLTDFDENCH
jgi:hypothetical protein